MVSPEMSRERETKKDEKTERERQRDRSRRLGGKPERPEIFWCILMKKLHISKALLADLTREIQHNRP